MAKAGSGIAKCFIFFMACVILLQGAAYLGLSIWGLTLTTCNNEVSDITSNPLKFATELIYFKSEKCGAPTVTVEDVTTVLTTDWSKSYDITHREYAFFISYAVISGLWVAFSFFIITTLCSPSSKMISAVCYWPWFLFVIGGSILDVVATVYHAFDVSNTTTAKKAFEYTGFGFTGGYEGEIWNHLLNFDSYFVTPAVIMICISCRIVVLWLLNIFGAFFVLSFSRILAADQRNAAAPKPTDNSTPLPRPASNYQPPLAMQEEINVVPQTPTRQQYEEYPEQIRPKPLPIIIPGANNGDARNYQQADRTTMQSPVAVLPPPQPAQQQYEQRTTPPSNAPVDTTYRTTAAHPDRLNYPPTAPTQTPEVRTPSPEMQQLAVTSPLNTRYSETFAFANQPNPRISEELRSQLPWSYTSAPAKPPPPPRKPQVQMYPQIPEPDYIEH